MNDSGTGFKSSDADRNNSQPSKNNTNQVAVPWNKIIVNQIPDNIDQQKFIAIFAEFGKIVEVYLSMEKKKPFSTQGSNHEYAIITFNSETEAKRVLIAHQQTGIKYDDASLMITQASDDYCPIENLPDDCLREIFLRLTNPKDKLNCEAVSKRWKKIAEKSWSNIREASNGGYADKIIVRSQNCLRKIDLSLSWHPDNILKLIADNCKQLQEFCLTDTEGTLGNIIDPLCSLILENKNLQTINIYTNDCRADGLQELIDAFPDGLKRLFFRMYECEDMVDSLDISELKNLEILILLQGQFPSLKLQGIGNLLSLKTLRIHTFGLHPDNFLHITHLTNLENLSIPDCQISNYALGEILKNNKKLKFINISYNTQINDSSFQYVRQLPKLEVLIMKGLRNVTDRYFANMPTLKVASIHDCSSITDVGMKNFFKTAENIEVLYTYGAKLSAKTIKLADQWTRRTGKSLKLSIECFDDWGDFDAEEIGYKLDYIEWDPDYPRDDEELLGYECI